MISEEAIQILKPLTECSVDENGVGTFPMVSTSLQAEALELAIKALEERPKGEWEEYACTEDRGCSLCGYMVSFYREHHFCPNCGADMRGEAEDENN